MDDSLSDKKMSYGDGVVWRCLRQAKRLRDAIAGANPPVPKVSIRSQEEAQLLAARPPDTLWDGNAGRCPDCGTWVTLTITSSVPALPGAFFICPCGKKHEQIEPSS